MNNFLSIRSMLIGTLLGDSHIRRNLTGSYITFEQSLAKSEYLFHLYGLVNTAGLSLNPPVQYNRTNIRYPGVVTSSLHFRTISHEIINGLADLFLDANGNKVIPINIVDYLDIVVLSY